MYFVIISIVVSFSNQIKIKIKIDIKFKIKILKFEKKHPTHRSKKNNTINKNESRIRS